MYFRLHEDDGHDIAQKMKDEIRQWFVTHKEVTGKYEYRLESHYHSLLLRLPSIPPKEAGGSAKINFTVTPDPENSEKGFLVVVTVC